MRVPQKYWYLALLGLFVVVSLVSLWVLTEKPPKEEITPVIVPTLVPERAPTQSQEPVTTEPVFTKFTEAERYADGGRFTNQRFKYSFAYPAGTTITRLYPASVPEEDYQRGLTYESLRKQFGADLCVIVILPAGGSVAVSAKENFDGKYTPCSRTGIGVADINEVFETVEIAGKAYTARGLKIDASKEEGYISYEYDYTLPDNTRIFFTWLIDAKHPESSLVAQKQEVMNTLKSISFN